MHSKKAVFGFVVVSALVVLLAMTATGQGQPQYRLGGTFIGSNDAGNVWSALQIPLDPAGQTAALRVKLTLYNADFAGLLAAFGADAVSEYVGEEKMISRDTASYRTVAYFTLQGSPRAILVMVGTIQFSGRDTMAVSETTEVYTPESDGDGDGYPDAGATPVFAFGPLVDHARRVPNE